MVFEEIIIDIINLGAYALLLMFGIHIIKKLYGGKFSPALPYIVAAVFLIFFENILNIFIFFWFPTTESTHVLKSSTQLLTVIAGIALLSASYKFYLLSYATAGFIKKTKKDGICNE